MSKDRNMKTETLGPELQQESTNGQPLAPPKKRRVLSTPLQAMANVEREMEKLNHRQQLTVARWFIDTYAAPAPGCPDMGDEA